MQRLITRVVESVCNMVFYHSLSWARCNCSVLWITSTMAPFLFFSHPRCEYAVKPKIFL